MKNRRTVRRLWIPLVHLHISQHAAAPLQQHRLFLRPPSNVSHMNRLSAEQKDLFTECKLLKIIWFVLIFRSMLAVLITPFCFFWVNCDLKQWRAAHWACFASFGLNSDLWIIPFTTSASKLAVWHASPLSSSVCWSLISLESDSALQRLLF